MKARRIAFFVILAVMLVTGSVEFFVAHPNNHIPHLRHFFWIGSPFAMLVWCALFIKSETGLARIGIILAVVDFLSTTFVSAP
jgi:hypothetical protein